MNDRVCRILCHYLDKIGKEIDHVFLNTLSIFMQKNAHTSSLFDVLEANAHLKTVPQCAAVFHPSPSKVCFQLLDFS